MAKNIVILLDGTWNNAISQAERGTNIDTLSQSISPINQAIHYHKGVGEHVGWVTKRLWGLTGKGVFQTAREAWKQVSMNYVEGDRIYILGFSRGSFAAWQLARMIVRNGLKGWQGTIEEEFRDWYQNAAEPVTSVKKDIHFLGLFDCVAGNRIYKWRDRIRRDANPGLIGKTVGVGINHFRHAVSRDERRWSFRPIVFQRDANQASFAQHWFPGYHSDVGGGMKVAEGLAAFSLWWMIREAYGLGLEFNNIDCQHHRNGHALNVIRAVDPEAEGVSSDYWTTKLGLVWNRPLRETDPLPDATPQFSELEICPRCGEEMFDYFKTDVGRSWLKAKGLLKVQDS